MMAKMWSSQILVGDENVTEDLGDFALDVHRVTIPEQTPQALQQMRAVAALRGL